MELTFDTIDGGYVFSSKYVLINLLPARDRAINLTNMAFAFMDPLLIGIIALSKTGIA